MVRLSACIAVVVTVCFPVAGFAQSPPVPPAMPSGPVRPPTLRIGSPAPALSTATWVKGKPVALGDGVRVVEFWATWCAPCRVTIPHLTALAKKYAGKANVVGISVRETGADVPGDVKAFVTQMGDTMDYAVARDDAANTINRDWLEASGEDGIPTAFVVDKTGTVVWIGHPMDGLDEAVGKVVSGNYSVAGFIKDAEEKRDAQKKQQEKYAKLDALFAPALRLADTKDYAGAVAAINTTLAENPQYTGDVAFIKTQLMLMYDEKAAQAYAVQAAGAELKNDAPTLARLAWGIVAPQSKLKQPDYKAALVLAQAANKASGGTDADIWDTLSFALEKAGNRTGAWDAAQKAIATFPVGGDPQALAAYKARAASLAPKKAP